MLAWSQSFGLLLDYAAFKIFMATNHKPIIKGTEHGIWRRIREANPPTKRIGKQGRPKKGKDLSLIVLLDEHRHKILRFMKEPAIPFDNNMAERDLGMVKVRQKISGTFRNMSRVDDYC